MDLVGALPDREATDDIEDPRIDRWAGWGGWGGGGGGGGGGGPMEVRDAGSDARALLVADGTRTVDGVPVRDTLALEEPLSCLVGDLEGDLVLG